VLPLDVAPLTPLETCSLLAGVVVPNPLLPNVYLLSKKLVEASDVPTFKKSLSCSLPTGFQVIDVLSQ
jgi:hypothetical protein